MMRRAKLSLFTKKTFRAQMENIHKKVKFG